MKIYQPAGHSAALSTAPNTAAIAAGIQAFLKSGGAGGTGGQGSGNYSPEPAHPAAYQGDYLRFIK